MKPAIIAKDSLMGDKGGALFFHLYYIVLRIRLSLALRRHNFNKS